MANNDIRYTMEQINNAEAIAETFSKIPDSKRKYAAAVMTAFAEGVVTGMGIRCENDCAKEAVNS